MTEQLREDEIRTAAVFEHLITTAACFSTAATLILTGKLQTRKEEGNYQGEMDRITQNILALVASDPSFTNPDMLHAVLREMGERDRAIRDALWGLIYRGEISIPN